MALTQFKNTPFWGRLVLPLWQWDAQEKFRRLQPFLKSEAKILEIGSGLGSVTSHFRQQGLQITPVDIADASLLPGTTPQIYDGGCLPFTDRSFDTVLLLTVLHHIADPIQTIGEAQRVGNTVLIIEDIYTNPVQKYLTYGVDSLMNLEFRDHPHSNHTDAEWQSIFQNLGLELIYTESYAFVGFFRQVIYVLRSPQQPNSN
ncbi:MAG: class I SAM-dependent methyltransferase [Prochlorothrix sp.]|nr:class I SAM-dependent methyltransferase [Prochlorothrix sp.]